MCACFLILITMYNVFLVSASVIDNSVIFPKSAVAFLILPIRELVVDASHFVLDEEVVDK